MPQMDPTCYWQNSVQAAMQTNIMMQMQQQMQHMQAELMSMRISRMEDQMRSLMQPVPQHYPGYTTPTLLTYPPMQLPPPLPTMHAHPHVPKTRPQHLIGRHPQDIKPQQQNPFPRHNQQQTQRTQRVNHDARPKNFEARPTHQEYKTKKSAAQGETGQMQKTADPSSQPMKDQVQDIIKNLRKVSLEKAPAPTGEPTTNGPTEYHANGPDTPNSMPHAASDDTQDNGSSE